MVVLSPQWEDGGGEGRVVRGKLRHIEYEVPMECLYEAVKQADGSLNWW